MQMQGNGNGGEGERKKKRQNREAEQAVAEGEEKEKKNKLRKKKKKLKISGPLSRLLWARRIRRRGSISLKKKKKKLKTSEPTIQAMNQVTHEGPKLCYCIVPSGKRFILLGSFLQLNLSKKMIVLFNSYKSVEFYWEILGYMQINCSKLHEKQEQPLGTSAFSNFCKAEKGILLCTEVAVHGLDIPSVDWILQYDPPYGVEEYVDTLGGEGSKGKAILFLIPQEEDFISCLKDAKVNVEEVFYGLLWKVRSYLVTLVSGNYYLHESAKDAYRSYVSAYKSHRMKNIFNIDSLDLQAVAASFCLSAAPSLN